MKQLYRGFSLIECRCVFGFDMDSRHQSPCPALTSGVWAVHPEALDLTEHEGGTDESCWPADTPDVQLCLGSCLPAESCSYNMSLSLNRPALSVKHITVLRSGQEKSLLWNFMFNGKRFVVYIYAFYSSQRAYLYVAIIIISIEGDLSLSGLEICYKNGRKIWNHGLNAMILCLPQKTCRRYTL